MILPSVLLSAENLDPLSDLPLERICGSKLDQLCVCVSPFLCT